MNDYGDLENKVEGVSSKVWTYVKSHSPELLLGLIIGFLFGLCV